MAQKSQDRKHQPRSGANGHRTRSHAPGDAANADRQDGDALRDAQVTLAMPAAHFGELSLRAFEQMARFGYALAGDVLDLTLEQMRATVTARDFDGWANRQGELAAGFISRRARLQA